jgi:hypothetical protein
VTALSQKIKGIERQARRRRSNAHVLEIAAGCLQQDQRNPKLIEDIRAIAKSWAEGWTEDDEKRAERQRTLFGMLPSSSATDRLKTAMMQRAYDLLSEGRCDACDALLEFLPSIDAGHLLDCWEGDQDGKPPLSVFCHHKKAA